MKKKETFHHRIRLWFIGLFFIALGVVLLWRMGDLTVLHRSFLQGQGNARSVRVISNPAYRGMILDRENVPLAVSTPVQSLWVNPKTFHPTSNQLTHLARLLDTSPKQLRHILSKAKNHEFYYLQRQLAPTRAKDIADLKIPGTNFQEEYKRFYPEADSTAQLLGFTNVDDIGIEGLELAYQPWLEGVNGKKRVVKDRYGRVIEELETIKEPRAGHALNLSIDHRIQFFAYHELQATIERFGAKSGSVVVLDTQTGEVLAAVNAPSFNPNARNRYALQTYRNKALTDLFEPGSVIKPFSIASALESRQVTADTIIDTRPGWMMVHGHIIRDVHGYGVLDVSGVLRHSSNVGVTKMVLLSPAEQLINLLTRCGVGQRTESGYPGESEGTIVSAKDINPFVLATLSFGYGVSATAMQIAKSYMVFANHGRLPPISLIRQDAPVMGPQVMSAKTADQLLVMLEDVVNGERGTGRSAMVPGYRVAGKTGTARVAGVRGYQERRFMSSFVGIAPASHPKLIVAVFITEPTKGGYYGAQVAAPLFAKVMGSALRILDVTPDQPI
ncbi:MAG: penicillin-binding protein 2 [Legionellales bacterium]|nr:penicillin-binding protein 2 [Legionellales bacterium]